MVMVWRIYNRTQMPETARSEKCCILTNLSDSMSKETMSEPRNLRNAQTRYRRITFVQPVKAKIIHVYLLVHYHHQSSMFRSLFDYMQNYSLTASLKNGMSWSENENSCTLWCIVLWTNYPESFLIMWSLLSTVKWPHHIVVQSVDDETIHTHGIAVSYAAYVNSAKIMKIKTHLPLCWTHAPNLFTQSSQTN